MIQSLRIAGTLRFAFLPLVVLAALGGMVRAEEAQEQVDFEKQIKPILERSCVRCHGPEKTEGDFAMNTLEEMVQGGASGEALVPGSAEDSHLFYRITLPADDPTVMPAEGDPLKEEEVELIRRWIDQGANWPEQLVLVIPEAMRTKPLTEEDLGVEITQAEEQAIEQARQMQALAMRLAQNTNWLRVDFSLGSQELADDQLAVLQKMDNLYELDLGGTNVTDAGLAHLKEMKNLRRLHLERTKVTDAGLAHLSGLEKLQYLNLYGTQVTNAGLEHLKGLKNLKKLYLWQTEVTPEGAEQLQAALPEVEINLGLEQAVAQVDPEEGQEKQEEGKEEKKEEPKKDDAKQQEKKEEPKDEKPKEEEPKEEKPEEEKPKEEKPAEEPKQDQPQEEKKEDQPQAEEQKQPEEEKPAEEPKQDAA